MFFFFFFSSRRRHTRWTGDWSSDVCSSDLEKFSPKASLLGPNSLGKTLDVITSALNGVRKIELSDTDVSKVGLPKVRLNPAVGIIEIASGCMSECTFCQTKIAKGDLASYRVGDIVRQVRHEIEDGCAEVWLTSTDNGCYGLDIGSRSEERRVGKECRCRWSP